MTRLESRPDFEAYRSLRLTSAAVSMAALVAGGYPVLALVLVAFLAALVLVVLRWEHRPKDGVMNALYRSISALLVRLGWNQAAHSPAHGWLLPTPAFVRAARASAKDPSPRHR